MKHLLAENFKDINGGLFSTVLKADVGNIFEQLAAQGVEMLSWADPFRPDDIIAPHVKAAAIREMETGFASHYTTPTGDSELKAAIAKKLLKQGITADPERNILITPGSDSGLLFAMMPFLNPGDEVLVPDPSYPSNFLNPQLLGAKAVPVPLGSGYSLDVEAFRRLVSPKTKMVLLTNPNNPTSTVFTEEEMLALCEFIIERDLILVVDQAFEDFIFDGLKMVSAAALPGMWERTVSVYSISKGMALSGFRVGYIVASDVVMNVLYGCAVNVIGATSTAFQRAALAAFEDMSFMDKFGEIFDRRRKKVHEMMNSVEGVSMEMPQSGFLSWIDVSKLGSSDFIVNYLIENAKVYVNSGTPYGSKGEGFIRLSHGAYLDDERIYGAIGRIRDALVKLGNK